ncbi:oligopeptide/dipeptide ABC transporter ATP-binding protein [Plastoroseomonas arctica]|uniref:ABC transporter ATP-binding protein n=1 Tax=Plastoroseomonas arctica TaxID=1509237 RepID=A0AAF1JYJ1_9PROT|nr:ABC transporter ATP-binding protein [Plastoroseomonas arctica]MBR0656989.1 ABC transporter ATP-binding protein [Plastoroseomonas arctica]
MTTPLLLAQGLGKTYALKQGRTVTAVADVDLALTPGAALGLVGESGCGKSTLARLLLRLTPATAGRISFAGTDITRIPERALRPLRRRMQIIHQNPSAALDPRLTAGAAVAEPLIIQNLARGAALRARVAALLAEVGLTAEFLNRFPHELSGGQKQRVCIARALATEPELLVLDEPTSALDVSVQAQILEFLETLRATRGLAWVFISHNLAVVRLLCEEVAVMYLGRIVEQGPANTVLGAPLHPYTRALLASVPRLGQIAAAAPGEPPNPAVPPSGCAFHPRCPLAEPRCRTDAPALRIAATGHAVACHLVPGTKRAAL